LTKKS
jgi:hypothetical protein